MSEQLVSILTDLSSDPFKRHQFREDPEAFLTAAGLEGIDRQLVLDGDAAGIREQFGVYLASARNTESKPKGKKAKSGKKKK